MATQITNPKIIIQFNECFHERDCDTLNSELDYDGYSEYELEDELEDDLQDSELDYDYYSEIQN
ncbi:18323_t:CDS:2 [Dentiscutata erythropus]|uniref:18323_t:CDS:1 n=1 Tax=Dentiscutata erythropus TaxID=1348616 RepID=A0A9N9F0W9_9GLOM|nr:18323_t:CDS:2 [Dentiscutata erythropus]